MLGFSIVFCHCIARSLEVWRHHCITFAKPSISCLLYFLPSLYYAFLIREILIFLLYYIYFDPVKCGVLCSKPSVCVSLCVYALRVSVCVPVSLSASISLEQMDRSVRHFVWRSPVPVGRSSSSSVALPYVLPVLWMTSRLAVMGARPARVDSTQHRRSVTCAPQPGRTLMCMNDCSVLSECVGLTSHSTYNRSFRRWIFPGNQLHWYWQPKTIKHNTTYTRNTKEKQKKTALANKTIYTLIWYAFYDLRSEMGPILTVPEPTQGTCSVLWRRPSFDSAMLLFQ